jgi:hypothetical protein
LPKTEISGSLVYLIVALQSLPQDFNGKEYEQEKTAGLSLLLWITESLSVSQYNTARHNFVSCLYIRFL